MTGRTEREVIRSAEDLGRVIRSRRKAAGLTQTDLATAANTSLMFVSELERGKPTARLDGTLRVAAALGIEIEAGSR